jgi:uncharacterized protein (DUF488 family)
VSTEPEREPVLTVGHSTMSAERLRVLLKEHGVSVVIDVRSQPFSRHVPHFNREPLSRALEDAGIAYRFYGRELGARSPDPRAYDDDGRVMYAALRSASGFRERCDAVIVGSAKGHRQVLMCTEADPADCHRAVLVAQCLYEDGVVVEHLRSDGRRESHFELLERISGQPDLFSGDDAQRHQRGLWERERIIAYRNPAHVAGETTML